MPTHAEHYFSATPGSASNPHEIRAVLGGLEVHLASDVGVFSHGHLDPGTAILLRRAPAPPATGALLDLGCGYGPVACWLALRSPGAEVVAVDVNDRALDLTRQNAARHDLVNVVVAEPDQVDPALSFAAIYSNPPIHVGKPELHALLGRWLARLEPGGHAYLVVQKHLGSDSLQRWLAEEGWACERLTSVRGYRVLDVSAAGA